VVRGFDPQPDPPGKVIFGSADGTLQAVSTTGRPLWRVALGAPVTSPLLACFPPDPCKVIVGAGHVLYAFDLSGARLWAAVLAGGDIATGGAVTIDPTPVRVAVAAGGTLYALNAADGSLVWSSVLSRTALADPAAGNPGLVRSPRILVGDHGGMLYSVDPGTGAVLGRFAAGGPITAPPAIGDPNLSGPWEFTGDARGDIYGFDTTDAFGPPVWADHLGGPVDGPPVLANGVLYVGTDPAIGDPNLFALDAATGRVLFQTTLPGGIASAAMVADGKVVLALASGQVVGYKTPGT
jgi:outer membrane protein assembly factor BamB